MCLLGIEPVEEQQPEFLTSEPSLQLDPINLKGRLFTEGEAGMLGCVTIQLARILLLMSRSWVGKKLFPSSLYLRSVWQQ